MKPKDSGDVVKVYFSDIFEVDPDVVEEYGALNISLINDLPLFIDPFLLFNSKKPEYQALHDDILEYLSFLRDMSIAGNINPGLLKNWFIFPEVKQNWLGFSEIGNEGSGLGLDFARALNKNLNHIFSNFGEETITKSSHLEKLCLITPRVGKDNISDFTTNLIKKFLLEYTQAFAQTHLSKSWRDIFAVERVYFNYETRSWATTRFEPLNPMFNAKFKKFLSPQISESLLDRIIDKTSKLNEAISKDKNLGPGFQIGHSFFCNTSMIDHEDKWYRRIIECEIAPLLREYWFDDLERAEAEISNLLD